MPGQKSAARQCRGGERSVPAGAGACRPARRRAGHASAAVLSPHNPASPHHAQAQPCGCPAAAAAASTGGTSNADATMPKPVPP